jgi:hypothetical protein
MPAEDILRSMGSPETAEVHGETSGSHTPQYLVLPSTLPLCRGLSNNCKVKVIDIGSAFISGDPSPKMRCPLPFRGPEAVITDSWDVEADIWSLGCTVRDILAAYSRAQYIANVSSDICPDRRLPTLRLFLLQRRRACWEMDCNIRTIACRVGESFHGSQSRYPLT